jgi:hypothetical protein
MLHNFMPFNAGHFQAIHMQEHAQEFDYRKLGIKYIYLKFRVIFKELGSHSLLHSAFYTYTRRVM